MKTLFILSMIFLFVGLLSFYIDNKTAGNAFCLFSIILSSVGIGENLYRLGYIN